MPSFIHSDYWQPPAGSAFSVGSGPASTSVASDIKDVTGAERLHADVTVLDRYAFQTDHRKLQLTQTISLAQLDPFAFQLFR